MGEARGGKTAKAESRACASGHVGVIGGEEQLSVAHRWVAGEQVREQLAFELLGRHAIGAVEIRERRQIIIDEGLPGDPEDPGVGLRTGSSGG